MQLRVTCNLLLAVETIAVLLTESFLKQMAYVAAHCTITRQTDGCLAEDLCKRSLQRRCQLLYCLALRCKCTCKNLIEYTQPI